MTAADAFEAQERERVSGWIADEAVLGLRGTDAAFRLERPCKPVEVRE